MNFYNFQNHNFKKNYGQNFLTNDLILNAFSEFIVVNKDDLIIEIGPGLGAFTDYLLKKSEVISIEIDTELVDNLNQRFVSNENFKLINDDFLSMNLDELISDNLERSKIVFTGSLPYNISKKIISNLLKLYPKYKNIECIFLIQKEVAEDYTLTSPKSSFLSSSSQVYSDVSYLMSVEKEYFHPIPKVDAGILKFINRPITINNHEKFIRFIKLGFSHPRKTVFNNLKSSGIKLGTFLNLGFTINKRPSEMLISDWKLIYETLYG